MQLVVMMQWRIWNLKINFKINLNKHKKDKIKLWKSFLKSNFFFVLGNSLMKETVQSSVVWLDDIYAIYLSLRKKLSLHIKKNKKTKGI